MKIEIKKLSPLNILEDSEQFEGTFEECAELVKDRFSDLSNLAGHTLEVTVEEC